MKQMPLHMKHIILAEHLVFTR